MRFLAPLVLLGCGRLGFDPAATDAAADGTTADAFDSDASTLAFEHVQNSFTCINQQARIDVVLPQPQTAGNFNLVVIGINDITSTLTSVTDAAGNNYAIAIGPTASSGLRQWMYYAVPIAASASNTITVTFDQPGILVGVTVAEYSGVSHTNAIEATSGGQGQSMNSDSGPAMVDGPALLIGANSNALPATSGPGPGYTQRVITTYEDILEDRVVTMGGTYRADAPLTTSHDWVMQLVALNPR